MAEALHRQLVDARGGRLSRTALAEQVVPKGTPNVAEKTFAETLRELLSIGALTEDQEQIRLPDIDGARSPGAMRNIVRACAMRNELEVDLWEKDAEGSLVLAGARDLVRALAWFLGLNVLDGPFDFEKTDPALDELQEQHLGPGVRPILNVERWRAFVRWARYLGFSSDVSFYSGSGSSLSALMPDPTRALISVLPTCTAPDEWIPLRTLTVTLAERLPVLDGGTYRRAMIDHGMPETPGDCSPALTLSLLRLQGLGMVELDEGTGDAPKLVFANNQGAFHALKWTGPARAG